MLNKKELEKALIYYNKALDIDTTLGLVYNKIGNLHLISNDTSSAINIFLKAYEFDYSNYEFHLKLGNLYKCKKDTINSIKHFTLAIEYDDKKSNTYYERGILYFYSKQFDLSLSDLNQSISINKAALSYLIENKKIHTLESQEYKNFIKPYILPYIYRARIKELYRDYYGVLFDCDLIIRASPNNGKAYILRGNTHHILGNFEEACKDWSRASDCGEQDGMTKLLAFCVNLK